MRYLIEAIRALRNNDVRKLRGYDPAPVEHLRKIVRGHLKQSSIAALQRQPELNVGFDELLAAQRGGGRWWLVGAAWTGDGLHPESTEEPVDVAASLTTAPSTVMSERLEKLARGLRINTDLRRAIFCAIMGAGDYGDAYQRLKRLSLKPPHDRDCVHILLRCCSRERKYNSFYAVLARKLVVAEGRYKQTLKLALWDRMRQLGEESKSTTAAEDENLAAFVGETIANGAQPISVLRRLDYARMDATLVDFLRMVLAELVLGPVDERQVKRVFGRLRAHKDRSFREAMRLFVRHFLLEDESSERLRRGRFTGVQPERIAERCAIVEGVLSAE